MAINPDIRDSAYQFFIQEAPELLQMIEAGLLTLRQDHSTTKAHNLMRAAHSIKGGAASVGLDAIATLAHRLENIVKALYSDTLEIDTELESQFLQAYDCLRLPLIEQLTTGSFDIEHALTLAEPIFAQIEERLGDALAQTDHYIPSSAELGVDMTRSLFEVDVQQGLERLASVIANPSDYEVAGELRSQAEVFAGFAELLNLSEFGAIAQATLDALAAHPERVLVIAQQALTDFHCYRQAVLAGVSPSAKLPNEVKGLEAVTISPEYVVENTLITPQSNPDTPDYLETLDVEWVADTTFLDEDAVRETPSLEEVFGSAFANLETEDVASSSIVPITSTSNSLQKLPYDVVDYTDSPETLEIAVQSIEQIFDSLSPIQDIPTLTSKSTPVGSKAALPLDTVGSKASPTPNLSVRVDLERLERMNNLVGELAINRNGLSLQNEQLQGTLRELLKRFTKVQNMVGDLRKLSDQMLVGVSVGSQRSEEFKVGRLNVGGLNSNSFQPNLQPSNLDGQLTTDKSYFDSLELDSYGALQSRLQGLLEEMMQLEESVDDIVLFSNANDLTLDQQRQMLTQLRDELMWARMLPLKEVLNRFPRVLRDLSATYHKPVNLKLSGTSVLIDKAVLEKLYDPLLHLLRNAFDHGIEFPQNRLQQGKPEEGQIEIRAYHRGSQTIIEVIDDGQGLNVERIGHQAVERGLLSAEQLATISLNQLFELLFEPGFSTANQVSELSGRGVGLDVVRSQIRSLKGTIALASSPGKGTTVTLRLPLTLSVAKLLVCFVGPTALALPSDSIEEIVVPKSEQVKQLGTQRFLLWREQIVPTYRLADFLSYACPLPETSPSKALIAVPSPKNWALPMLVLKQGQQVFALETDRLVTEQELVIKPFGEVIAPPSCTYGCTILGDGSLIPVIDAAVLIEQLFEENTGATATTTRFNHRHAITSDSTPSAIGIESQEASVAKENSSISQTPDAIRTAMGEGLIGTNRISGTTNKVKLTPTVLVVDDAVALRRTLALTLERVGFRVLQARDGREALEQLQQTSDSHGFATGTLSIDLVICDIEMPNMNGFEFLSQRRQDPQLFNIPVVMLTSRSNDKHRWLAMQLGATAYFTKPYLERDFVAAIKNIISQYAENR